MKAKVKSFNPYYIMDRSSRVVETEAEISSLSFNPYYIMDRSSSVLCRKCQDVKRQFQSLLHHG